VRAFEIVKAQEKADCELPKKIAASRRPSVEKIVDYFHPSCANISVFPLVNPCRILIEKATLYLSTEIGRTLRSPGGFAREQSQTPVWKGFHSCT
jgi:hypothetical protein